MPSPTPNPAPDMISLPHEIMHYGWIPDLPDQRDLRFAAPAPILAALPPHVDLRPHCPPIYDQGQLGSCTANAIGGAIQFEQMKQGIANFVPSRLFIYYNERVIEGTVQSDSGAMLRDGLKTAAKEGAPPETRWPYILTKFRNRPTRAAYKAGKQHLVQQYQSVDQDLDQMKACLAAGFPFIVGFSVYESFESQQVAQTGQVPMPAVGERLKGGHAVLAVGYDDAQSRFIMRNSWGTGWGMHGYFTFPYAYLTRTDLSSDFWTIRSVTG